MTFGSFNSSEPTMADDLAGSFFFNKSLQQRGLEFRLGDLVDDIRYDMRLVGGALLTQQERAARRYEKATHATTDAVERQTAQVRRLREEQATQARELQSAVEDSARVLRASVDRTTAAVTSMHGAVIDQLSHVRWALAEQNHLLTGIFETLREGRSNECRQLVEQGERNMQARYYTDAEERLQLALTYDNTDHVLHQNLGLVSVHLGKPDVALEHFRKAYAFPPKVAARNRDQVDFFLARAATHIARVLYAKGDYRAAADSLERALKHDPRGAKNWYDLAVVSAYDGDATRATDALRKAIEVEPEFYAQALGDTELDPVRGDIDRLLLRLRNEKNGAVKLSLSGLARLERVAAAARQVLPSVSRVPQDLQKNTAAALERNTFFALHGALTDVEAAVQWVPTNLTTEIDTAIRQTEAMKETAKRDMERAHASEIEQLRRAHDAASDTERQAHVRPDFGCLPHLALSVVGGIVGLILGFFVGAHLIAAVGGVGLAAGAGVGLAIGAIVPPLLYAKKRAADKGSSKGAAEATRTQLEKGFADVQAKARKVEAEIDARLRALRSVRAEVTREFA